jgi:hypothetical protein
MLYSPLNSNENKIKIKSSTRYKFKTLIDDKQTFN